MTIENNFYTALSHTYCILYNMSIWVHGLFLFRTFLRKCPSQLNMYNSCYSLNILKNQFTVFLILFNFKKLTTFTYTLLEKCCRISLYVTHDAIAKLYELRLSQIEGNGRKFSHITNRHQFNYLTVRHMILQINNS